MNRDLQSAIDGGGGVASRSELLARVPVHVLESAVRSGRLVRVYPRTFADAARADEPWVRAAGALAYAGPGSALSHLTALGLWRLPGGSLAGPVHITVGDDRRLRATDGIVVHRASRLCDADVTTRHGLSVTRLERTVVAAWRLLTADTRRAAVIAAVADRRTTPARVRTAVDRDLNVPGRGELMRLLNLLAQGCRSELELWGYDHVFAGPDMPPLERNVPVRIGKRTIYLDVYSRRAEVDFELDGTRWHSSTQDRERDARRDSALATMDIMVVRFTHDRLVRAPDEVRAEVKAIIARRRAGKIGGSGR
jgi:Protein of unknown function (DUF559)